MGIEIDAHLGQDALRRRHHLALVEQSRSTGRFAIGEDIAGHRQVGKEIQLLEDDADAELPGLQGIADDHRFAAQDERPAVRLIDAGQHLHDRRLAGAVLPHDGVDLAGGNPERHVVDGGDAAEALGDAVQPDDVRCRGRSVMAKLASGEVPPGRASRRDPQRIGYGSGVARGIPGRSQIVIRPGHGLEIREVLGHVLLVVVVLDLIVGLARDVVVDVLGRHDFGRRLEPALDERRAVDQVLGEHAHRQIALQILLLADGHLRPAVLDRLQRRRVEVVATDQPRAARCAP